MPEREPLMHRQKSHWRQMARAFSLCLAMRPLSSLPQHSHFISSSVSFQDLDWMPVGFPSGAHLMLAQKITFGKNARPYLPQKPGPNTQRATSPLPLLTQDITWSACQCWALVTSVSWQRPNLGWGGGKRPVLSIQVGIGPQLFLLFLLEAIFPHFSKGQTKVTTHVLFYSAFGEIFKIDI